MAMGTLSAILFRRALYWFWGDSLRSRERALEICARACLGAGVQLLDHTVVVWKLGLGRGPGGQVCIKRCYLFEFSTDGLERRKGRVVFLGAAVEYLSMEHPGGVTIQEA